MIIKYMTKLWRGSTPIQMVTVERETENSVWINGRRSAKHSHYEHYWDSWEDAHDYIVNEAIEDNLAAIERLETTQQVLSRVRALKKPEGDGYADV